MSFEVVFYYILSGIIHLKCHDTPLNTLQSFLKALYRFAYLTRLRNYLFTFVSSQRK